MAWRSLIFAWSIRTLTCIRLVLDDDAADARQDTIDSFEKAVEVGAKIADEMSCDDLVAKMGEVVSEAKGALSDLFASSSDLTQEPVVKASEAIMAFVTEADKRKCLPSVMAQSGTQEDIKALLDDHLGTILMSQTLPEPWCHDGITGDRWGWHGGPPVFRFKDEACCSPTCGDCEQGNASEIDGSTYACEDKHGGREQCCPWDIVGDREAPPASNCTDRSDTGCKIPEEVDPARQLENAYQLLVNWQRGTADLGGPDLDRELLLPEDVENPENCPAPCGECSRSHNSWRKGEEIFKFKCLLQRGQSPPSDHGLSCTEPRRRRSFWRPHRWGRKSWCEVEEWQTAVCNRVRVNAMMGCGIRLVVSPFVGGRDHGDAWKRESDYEDCMKTEMKLTVEQYNPVDSVSFMANVPRENQVGFTLILSLGLANGLAALRDASKSAQTGVAFLDPFLQGRVVDEQARGVFNGTRVSHGTCDREELKKCGTKWKREAANRVANTFNTFILAAIFGFWGVFWGGLTFLGNSLMLGAVGWLLGGPLLHPFINGLYLTLVTSFAAIIGASSGIFHCLFWPNGVCSLFKQLTCKDERSGPYLLDQTWTDLLDKALEEE